MTRNEEGWAPMHANQRSFHYYRNHRALCGKWSLSDTQLSAIAGLDGLQSWSGFVGPEDCKTCVKKLQQEEKARRLLAEETKDDR